MGLAYAAAAMTAAIAVLPLWRDPRSFVHRVFALGLLLFAFEAAVLGFLFQSVSFDDFLFRSHIRLIAASLLPAAWLMFSVTFGLTNYAEQVLKWKWMLLAALAAPLTLAVIFYDNLLIGYPALTQSSNVFVRIGWAGYLWHLLWIGSALLILMNLERTFRHSTGHMRWQTKFMFLGVGALFGIHIFTDSQVLLFKGINAGLLNVNLGALLVANLLILRALFRGRPLNVSIQLSHQFLYNSFTILIVGIYFIAIGLMAWLSLYIGWIGDVNLSIFLVFVAVIGIAAVLLSDRLRLKRKRFISRHFKRPMYDYQKIWENFTEKTASVTQTVTLCGIIVRMVSETLEILSVSMWLVDEKQERLSFGGSTVITEEQFQDLPFHSMGGEMLIRAMIGQTMPVDLDSRTDDWVEDIKHLFGTEETKESRIRYCVPLTSAGHLVGIMTLSEKVYYEPLSFEETELLKTVSDQAAASLLNLRLSERLRQAKELEAFQAMSAFFMHDLKNLASKLSLVTQNLPVHIDNPEFRTDALKTISQSVTKINGMSSRLSLLSQKLELYFKDADLNELVERTVGELKDLLGAAVETDIETLPALPMDREQLHKVIENLLMNAYDAAGREGRIRVTTRIRQNLAELSISDDGCGMTKAFMEKNLFRPFQTTKKQGMGIGLYHSKTIIEGHGGRIEVESEEGKGTTFRVLLPIRSDK
jgi:putative PEP-CTERM system histidine kinase